MLDALWEPFQRVVSPVPTWLQGGALPPGRVSTSGRGELWRSDGLGHSYAIRTSWLQRLTQRRTRSRSGRCCRAVRAGSVTSALGSRAPGTQGESVTHIAAAESAQDDAPRQDPNAIQVGLRPDPRRAGDQSGRRYLAKWFLHGPTKCAPTTIPWPSGSASRSSSSSLSVHVQFSVRGRSSLLLGERERSSTWARESSSGVSITVRPENWGEFLEASAMPSDGLTTGRAPMRPLSEAVVLMAYQCKA